MHNDQDLAFPIYQYTVEVSIHQIELILRKNHIIFHDLKILMHSSPLAQFLLYFILFLLLQILFKRHSEEQVAENRVFQHDLLFFGIESQTLNC